MDEWMTHQMMTEISMNSATAFSVRSQIQRGADPNARVQAFDGSVLSPLAIAAAVGSYEVTKVLLDNGADATDIQAGPLNQAVLGGNIDVIDLLLDRGANVNMRAGLNEYTPLVTAANQAGDRWRVVEFLLTRGANPNRAARNGLTPLYVAAQHGNLTTMRTLISHGADVNSKTTRGNTPLINAADEGQCSAVKLLLQNGAEIDWKNSKGMTALDHARQKRFWDVIDVLVNAGAK